MAMFAPLGMLLMLLSLVKLTPYARPELPFLNWLAFLPLPVGAWLVVGFVVGILTLVRQSQRSWPWWRPRGRLTRTLLIFVALNAIAYLFLILGLVTATIALMVVLAGIAVLLSFFAFLTEGRPFLRIGLAAIFVAILGWVNGDRFKLSYPGLDWYYSHLVDFRVGTPMEPAALADRGSQPSATPSVPAITPAVAGEPPTAVPEPVELNNTIAKLRDEVRGNPKSLEARATLSKLLQKRYLLRLDRKDYERVAEDLSELLELSPGSPEVLMSRALVYAHLGKIDEGLNDWRTVQKLVLKSTAGAAVQQFRSRMKTRLLVRLHSRLRAGNIDGAKADADEAVALEPFSVDALGNRGIVRYLYGDKTGAQKDLELAVGQNPKSSEAQRNLAGFFRYFGDSKNAIKHFSAAIDIEQATEPPKQRGTWYRRRAEIQEVRAAEYRQSKQEKLAESDYRQVSRLRELADALQSPPPRVWRLSEGTPFVGDREALESWLQENHKATAVPGQKPVLVVIASSGGGIAAAYWTGKCLSEIDAQYPQFMRHVRIVTGASGGLFGAGVYVTRIGTSGTNDRLPKDTAEDSAKDCLTPAVRRMLLGDLPALLWPYRRDNDRGRALEQAWAENTVGTTETKFAELAEGERRGWRPSLIVSPMIVEDGKFLLISNLDLANLGGNEEFFKHFEKARDTFTVGTALRMNAAFPYVTPGVSLPTNPPRRVVDAGYLDNYGVSLACAWIERHRAWLADNTRGVILLQIRA